MSAFDFMHMGCDPRNSLEARKQMDIICASWATQAPFKDTIQMCVKAEVPIPSFPLLRLVAEDLAEETLQ